MNGEWDGGKRGTTCTYYNPCLLVFAECPRVRVAPDKPLSITAGTVLPIRHSTNGRRSRDDATTAMRPPISPYLTLLHSILGRCATPSNTFLLSPLGSRQHKNNLRDGRCSGRGARKRRESDTL